MQPISRRTFLQQGTGATLAALAVFQGKNLYAAPLKMPIGIQLYTVGAELQKDLNGTLKQVNAIGYREVETAGFAGQTAAEFRKALDDAGLACHSSHLQMESGDLEALFAEANTVGARYVVTSALFPPRSTSGGSAVDAPTVDAYKKMATHINEIARKAKGANLQYAYHNHNFEFTALEGGVLGYDILLKETDPDLVKFELDCGWIVSAGYSPADYFKKHPGRYKMIHVKDFVKGSKVTTSLAKGLRPQGTELGRGHIEYKPILEAARKAGVEYYYVEQEPPFLEMSALDAARVDYDYLHGL